MSNKKGDMSFEYIVAIILISILIIIVLLFIYNDKILGWIRILPGYQLPDEDIIVNEVIVDKETGSILNENCFGEINEGMILIPNGEPTGLYVSWFSNSNDGKVKLIRKWFLDKSVAEIKNLKINLFENIDVGSFDSPIKDDLILLDKSEFKKGTGKLCKYE